MLSEICVSLDEASFRASFSKQDALSKSRSEREQAACCRRMSLLRCKRDSDSVLGGLGDTTGAVFADWVVPRVVLVVGFVVVVVDLVRLVGSWMCILSNLSVRSETPGPDVSDLTKSFMTLSASCKALNSST